MDTLPIDDAAGSKVVGVFGAGVDQAAVKQIEAQIKIIQELKIKGNTEKKSSLQSFVVHRAAEHVRGRRSVGAN
jgi:hypothetical protein